jgi:hypothetical protein
MCYPPRLHQPSPTTSWGNSQIVQIWSISYEWHFTAKLWSRTVVNCFLKCGFALNHTSGGEGETEYSMKNGVFWDVMPHGVTSQKTPTFIVTIVKTSSLK